MFAIWVSKTIITDNSPPLSHLVSSFFALKRLHEEWWAEEESMPCSPPRRQEPPSTEAKGREAARKVRGGGSCVHLVPLGNNPCLDITLRTGLWRHSGSKDSCQKGRVPSLHGVLLPAPVSHCLLDVSAGRHFLHRGSDLSFETLRSLSKKLCVVYDWEVFAKVPDTQEGTSVVWKT